MKPTRLRLLGRWLRGVVYTRLWLLPLVLSVILSVVLIERKYGLFSTSFLSTSVLSPLQVPVFLLLTAWIDLTLLYTLCTLTQFASRVFSLGPRVHAVLTIALGSALVVGVNVVVYRIARYLGDLGNVSTALELGDGPWAYIAPFLSSEALVLAVFCSIFGLGCLLLWRLSRSFEQFAAPAKGLQLKGLLVLWAGTFGIEVVLTRTAAHPVSVQLQQTCLQKVMARGLSVVTDWDGDGFGWIETPRDFAPLNRSRHPLAIDVPGNGIDENGWAGDLSSLAILPTPAERSKPCSRPDVILVIACSLRRDVVFGGDLGASVMPALQALAQQGTALDQAYSHSGSTKSSIPSIYCGSLVDHQESLVRDFKAMGYQVAIFSAQDDRFARIFSQCSFGQADKYFGASMAPEDRVTTYTTLSSLMIAGSRVTKEVERFLKKQKHQKPMFLAVHLFTTHFPYAQDSPEQIIPHNPLRPHSISPSRRAELVEVYRNAAANLDLQIAQVLKAVRTHRPDRRPVIIVLADHGESLFDDGMLGHGLKINDLQTKIPCIIAGGWGTIATPLGHADLRGELLKMLATSQTPGAALKLQSSDRPVFQYTGRFSSPAQIAHLTSEGRVIIDFHRGTFSNLAGESFPLDQIRKDARCLALINYWESLRYRSYLTRGRR